jgi:hypothetical protein
MPPSAGRTDDRQHAPGSAVPAAPHPYGRMAGGPATDRGAVEPVDPVPVTAPARVHDEALSHLRVCWHCSAPNGLSARRCWACEADLAAPGRAGPSLAAAGAGGTAPVSPAALADRGTGAAGREAEPALPATLTEVVVPDTFVPLATLARRGAAGSDDGAAGASSARTVAGVEPPDRAAHDPAIDRPPVPVHGHPAPAAIESGAAGAGPIAGGPGARPHALRRAAWLAGLAVLAAAGAWFVLAPVPVARDGEPTTGAARTTPTPLTLPTGVTDPARAAAASTVVTDTARAGAGTVSSVDTEPAPAAAAATAAAAPAEAPAVATAAVPSGAPTSPPPAVAVPIVAAAPAPKTFPKAVSAQRPTGAGPAPTKAGGARPAPGTVAPARANGSPVAPADRRAARSAAPEVSSAARSVPAPSTAPEREPKPCEPTVAALGLCGAANPPAKPTKESR